MRVILVGASDKSDRYAYQALKLLREYGHSVFPVNPNLKTIEGIPVFPDLRSVNERAHTVTLYVREAISSKMAGEILDAKPMRIIFNPGAENTSLETAACARGIQTLRACTLVLLKTGQF